MGIFRGGKRRFDSAIEHSEKAALTVRNDAEAPPRSMLRRVMSG
jgi:hypothetical protein